MKNKCHLPPACDKNNFSGFTLVEMLAVLGVLSLLLVLLLPGLTTARGCADSAQCMNNARQVVLAWSMYCGDCNDSLPPNVDGIFGGLENWVAGNMGSEVDATNAQLLADARLSVLASYIKEPKLYKCPGDESRHVRSISMNCRLNPVRDESQGKPRWLSGRGSRFRVFRRLAEVTLPVRTAVCLDENARSINDGYFAVDMSNTGNPQGIGSSSSCWWVDYPGVYHSASTTVSFADLHIESHKWYERTTYAGSPHRRPVAAPSRDIEWLQQRCSYP